MGLVIYDEKKSELSEVAFVRDSLNQEKIRNVPSYDLIKQFALLFTKINAFSGIKNPIPDMHKADIKEMLMLRFKNLSVNEIEYAFKLERYGSLGEKTEHYQDFNANYVSQVLDKYTAWKRKIKLEHNISEARKEKTATEKEKQYWINRGVTECIEHYETNGSIMDGKIYVYDVLYDLGMLPCDVEYKKKIAKDAKEVLEFELNNKPATTTDEKKKIAQTLAEMQKPKSGILITKCKELVLLEFFRKLFREPKDVEKFKLEFKNEPQ